MQKIEMVDLNGQYLKLKSEIDSAIQKVIDSSAFINGPQVKDFSTNLATFLGVKHVIGCANGTDALQIALMALDLKPGDEIISPDFTFIATVEVIALLGLKPVLIDIDPETFTIDPSVIRKAITPKTKVIIPVHLFGLCANMGEIMKIAREFNLFVVEDNAQALGATYNDKLLHGKGGTIGDIGCTSFFPSKILGCYGDGGAIFTNNDLLAAKMKTIANHGSKIKYYNDEVGVNSRLDTLQAAILDVKLKYLKLFIYNRQKAASLYNDLLAGIDQVIIPFVPDYSDHIFHQYTIKVKSKRDELKKYLGEKGIPTMVYYPIPVHAQKAYKTEGNFPVSDTLKDSVLSLPMHTELEIEEQEYICEQIMNFYKN
jgi:UDP-2-acetamido-2-deoxy-ribo-hexuluronate aminotransferase